MNERLLRAMLRGVAVAIAVAAAVDPVWSVERARPVPITLIKMTTSDASAIEGELRRLREGTEVRVREVAQHRLPCGPGDRCVVIADGSVAANVPADLDQPMSLVTVGNTDGPNIRLQTVVLAAGQHAGAAGVARVTVEGRSLSGNTTEIKISDSAALVGSATIEWKANGPHTVDVPWWPLAPGPRTLRIEATPATGESVMFDNVLTAGIDVGSERLPVLVFDARPSWGSTFIRRALEDDPRFLVDHRARLAPAIAAGTASGRLDTRALDAASVLIVGGPDALTASEVDLIERYVRVRGGTAVLLPERAPAGSAARLFPGKWSERLSSEPQTIGALRATERLLNEGSDGAIVVAPTGRGRMVISTAMDAWRYRDEDGAAFDRFWRSVVAEGAAAGAPLRLEFENDIATPASRQTFTVRYRSMTPPSTIEASAVARCDQAQTIRLWPAGASGVMRGQLPVSDHSSCTVEVAMNTVTATGGIAVSRAPSHLVGETLATLARHARATGGVVTDEDNLHVLGAEPKPSPAPMPVRPMQSALWILPFAGCLSAEWWLRRRRGLR